MSQELQNEEAVILRARGFGGVVANSGDVLMYAPGGVHTITPACGQGAAEVTVAIDRATAETLNASLARMNARMAPQRCFIDKEHEGKEATAWPQSFYWSEKSPDGVEAPGVYLKAEFTSLGRELIDGKVFRAFSPSFKTDADLPKKVSEGQFVKVAAGKRGSPQNPARMTSVALLDVGTLTNAPAFKQILPLFASARRAQQIEEDARGAGKSTLQQMKKKTEQELATLRARKSELENQLPTLRAKDLTDAENVTAVNTAQAELETIETDLRAHEVDNENETLKNEIKATREKEADIAIKAAVKRGAIPAKQTELQASWKRRLVENPKDIELLDGIPSAPALQGGGGGSAPRIILHANGAQEMRASNRDVLKKYLEHVDGGQFKEAASLYAREIKPRMKEGDDIELRAADVTDANLGTIAGTLVAQRTLELFRLQFNGILQYISTDFSSDAGEFAQTTQTRIVVVPAVVSYDAALTNGEPNGWVQTTPAQTADVPVTLDQHKGVPIIFGSNVLGSTMRRLFDEQAPAAAYALTKDMIDALYANITTANFADYAANPNTTAGRLAVAEVDFGRRTFGTAGRIFNPAGVPMDNRFALLNSDYHDALEQDPTITNLAVYQQSQQGTITDGSLPPIKKFKPIEAPNFPTANNRVGFFGHKASLLVKSRVPNDYTSILPPGAVHGLTKVVTDPDTGISALVVWFANHQKGSANFRIAWMYGTAKGYTKGGLVLTNQ